MWTLTNSGKLIEKIESKQDELTAWEWIEIKNWPDYSAMQWPCPDWFHVPLKDEWINLIWILTTTLWLTVDYSTIWTYLKIPYTWSYDTFADNESLVSGYRSSSANDASSAFWVLLWNLYQALNPQQTFYHTYWLSIRPFKDTPIIPDSTWTIIYDWSSIATNAWIFHNTSLWLISVSWDWNTWYTIADKNLWATTVYNSWDTDTEANCWKSYQWWNNYWFPYRWSLPSSSLSTTKVDTTWYWPWNYYNNWVFIHTDNNPPHNWSSVQNDNLWWWVTWIVTFENVITNTGVLSVNGQTGDVTISAWSEIVYCTQAEYDALPSSKLTDGKSYVIYE